MQLCRTLTVAALLPLLFFSQSANSKPPNEPTEDLNENAILSLLTPKIIFATQAVYTGDLVSEALTLGYAAEDGLDAADYLCQSSAGAAGFKGSFKAVISSSEQNANARLSKSLGPYVLPDGTPVAESFAHLFSTRAGDGVAVPIVPPILLITGVRQTENGSNLGGPGGPFGRRAWTGSLANGAFSQFAGGGPPSITPTRDTCEDWTSSAEESDGCADPINPGVCGMTGQVLSNGTAWIHDERDGCDWLHRLYCAQQ